MNKILNNIKDILAGQYEDIPEYIADGYAKELYNVVVNCKIGLMDVLEIAMDYEVMFIEDIEKFTSCGCNIFTEIIELLEDGPETAQRLYQCLTEFYDPTAFVKLINDNKRWLTREQIDDLIEISKAFDKEFLADSIIDWSEFVKAHEESITGEKKMNKYDDVYKQALKCLRDDYEVVGNDVEYAQKTFDDVWGILNDFGVKLKKLRYQQNNYFDSYYYASEDVNQLKLAAKLDDEIKSRLNALSVRAYFCQTEDCVCFEVSSSLRRYVGLKEVLSKPIDNQNQKGVYAPIGIFNGDVLNCDLTQTPNLLIVGTTGSGKSVLLSGIILSLAIRYSPQQLRFLAIDTKQVELNAYEGLPHFVGGSTLFNVKEINEAFDALADEIDKRYDLFEKQSVDNLDKYNSLADDKGFSSLNRIVVVIDEFADLAEYKKELFDTFLDNVVAKGSRVGVHVIISTYAAEDEVISSKLKELFPCRIACRLSSEEKSRFILEQNDATKLLGNGDMLYKDMRTGQIQRGMAGYVNSSEIRKVVSVINDVVFSD